MFYMRVSNDLEIANIIEDNFRILCDILNSSNRTLDNLKLVKVIEDN